jgi:hypothetical protein
MHISYLYEELRCALEGKSTILNLNRTSDGDVSISLNPRVSFHLYVSQSPCM